jgi:hypothetical protein
LHLGFDNVNGIVKHNTTEACKTASKQINKNLVSHVGAQTLFSISKYDKTNTLICGLL